MSLGSSARAVARSVWNGPFHVGKLAQPVSTGDAIMKLLETLWRLIVLAVVVPAIGLALLFVWIEWITPTFFPPLKDQVKISIRNDWSKVEPPIIEVGKPFKCPRDYPLRVDLDNRSTRTIRKVNLTISATQPEHSTNLWNGTIFIDSDGIMEPHMGWRACYWAAVKDGYDPASLFYNGEINYVEE